MLRRPCDGAGRILFISGSGFYCLYNRAWDIHLIILFYCNLCRRCAVKRPKHGLKAFFRILRVND